MKERGFYDVIQIMKLNEITDKLVRDYWETAKGEKEMKGKR